jgi:hypothetical protein
VPKTLADYRADYYALSGSASSVSRQVAFAGIALIWIFKNDVQGTYTLPADLLVPALCFVLGLSLDLLQYVFATAVWGIFARVKEMQGASPDQSLTAPPYFNLPALVCFWGKVLAVLVGYLGLLAYLKSAIKFF